VKIATESSSSNNYNNHDDIYSAAIGDVQDCQGVSASEMTCIESSEALNATHSLTHLRR